MYPSSTLSSSLFWALKTDKRQCQRAQTALISHSSNVLSSQECTVCSKFTINSLFHSSLSPVQDLGPISRNMFVTFLKLYHLTMGTRQRYVTAVSFYYVFKIIVRGQLWSYQMGTGSFVSSSNTVCGSHSHFHGCDTQSINVTVITASKQFTLLCAFTLSQELFCLASQKFYTH